MKGILLKEGTFSSDAINRVRVNGFRVASVCFPVPTAPLLPPRGYRRFIRLNTYIVVALWIRACLGAVPCACVAVSSPSLAVTHLPPRLVQQMEEFLGYGLPSYYFSVMTPQDIAKHVMSLQGGWRGGLFSQSHFNLRACACPQRPRCWPASPAARWILNFNKRVRKGARCRCIRA